MTEIKKYNILIVNRSYSYNLKKFTYNLYTKYTDDKSWFIKPLNFWFNVQDLAEVINVYIKDLQITNVSPYIETITNPIKKFDGVIILESNYQLIEYWYEKIVNIYGNIPIIICDYKDDFQSDFHKNNIKYVKLSENYEEIPIKILCNEIKYKEFINKFQEIINGYLEIKDDKINELNCKINLIKKITF
jgi:hypothetical protein